MSENGFYTQGAFNKPLAEIKLEPRLRRQLANAGYDTLAEALDAPESDIEAALQSSKARDSWHRLLDSFERDPAKLAKELLEVPDPNRLSETKRSLAILKDDAIVSNTRYVYALTRSQSPREEKAQNPLPRNEITAALTGLERTANRSLAILADHCEIALIAESFPSLALVLDDIDQEIVRLFEYYSDAPSTALTYAKLYFPNCFLIFVANSASKDFDGDAFWKNLFAKIGVSAQGVQTDLKKSFYQGVKDKGLPFFAADNNDFHYLYTALLHGGFSKSFWLPMWTDVILPYSKNTNSTQLSRSSGRELLRAIRDSKGTFCLQREYAKKIIEKAPATMLEPLLDASLAVARDIIDSGKLPSGLCNPFEMLTTHGLPDAAMQALRDVLEGRNGNSRRRFVYLPSAEMRIDPANGKVHLHWDAQILPLHFAGRAVEYWVNGRCEHAADFVISVGKCLLPELDIDLIPNERFDIELILLDSETDRNPLASLSQTFNRTRPGSFEFVQGSDDVFRLRRKHERIAKLKRIAFLTKANLRVSPGAGMQLLENYEAVEEWGGASIQIFEVEPGASGSIVNHLTGEEVACWQENYRVEIDRSRVIGKTSDGRDLYGFSYSSIDTNDNLPDIVIDANDVEAIRQDLDIRCVCDGCRVSLPWKIRQDEADHELIASGKLVIMPSDTNMISKFVRQGQIVVTQKSTGAAILNYKFAVIPIRGFGIEEAFWDSGKPWATYSFEALDPITTPCEDGDYEMRRHDRYYFDAPLEDECYPLTIRNDKDGAVAEVSLSLSGLRITVPNDLSEVSSERPICSFDSEVLDGLLLLRSSRRRLSRSVYIKMGSSPLLLKQLRGNATCSVNIFRDLSKFKAASEERRDVEMILKYGERFIKGKAIEASASIKLVRCISGFGLGEYSLRRTAQGLCLYFENYACSDLEVRFFDRRGKKKLGISEIEEGQCFAVIPVDATYQLDTRKTVVVKIYALNLFGDANEDTAMTFELKR